MRSDTKFLSPILVSVLLLIFTIYVQAQTPELPGWHSQMSLAMTKQTCFETAKNALRSVGLTNQTSKDNWAIHGTNYNVRAGISCVSCGDGVHVTVLGAATKGYPEANKLRDRLKDYMLQGADNKSPVVNQAYKSPAGVWNTSYEKMSLSVQGNRVFGNYQHKNGKIEGALTGNTLKGMWYQSNGSGEVIFTFNDEFTSFSSQYEQNGRWYSDWTGTRKE